MKRNGKKSRKIRKLIVACTLSAVVLIVATYTWFIGMQNVSVNPFEIEIATTEGLFLSMDGETWLYNLDVTDYINDANTELFDGETNTWATGGLIPMSTIGKLDEASSRMKLYEKASLTTSPGGYRLLASQVQNGVGTDGKLMQGEGYVAFDLFIKNLSGSEYYPTNQVLNEEAIYLTTDSTVEVKNTGSTDTQLLTGIENSLRVGFAQIGRVEASTSEVGTITGIKCEDTYVGEGSGKTQVVTKICRDAQIWEPNDLDHVQNALNWYNKSCISRKTAGTDVTLPASYNLAVYDTDGSLKTAAGTCAEIKKTNDLYNYVTTYAISDEIKIADNVDVYDGHNSYKGSIYDQTNNATGKLHVHDYFTDTEKNYTGTARPEFMTLAPNSITKVRVYIWLEGQDIDNYDFAQLGKTISINFGFTKERFTETDVDYNGPDLVTSDNADIETPDKAE